jgi:hypothetical protein
MAYETVAVTAGSGTNIVCDQTSSGLIQVVKLDLGADGAESPVSGSLPIQDGGNSITVDGTVAVSGTVPVSDAAGSLTVDAPVGTPVFVRLSDGSSAITALPITDNAGSLTVDGTVAATQSGTWNVGTVTTVSAVTAISNALPAGTNNIGDMDVLSIVPGTGATNLGKAEDDVHSSGDVGVMALAVRQNSQSDLGADGDYVPITVDDAGGVRVSVVNGAAGGTSHVDDAAFTAGTTAVTPAGGFYASTIDTVNDGDAGALAMTIRRALHTVMVDAAGDEIGASASAPIAVQISNGSTFPTPGVDYTHDGALTVASTAGPALVGRASTATPSAVSADDDAALVWLTRNGAQVVVPAASVVGGATGGKLVSAASTNATNIKNAAGKLLMLTASNVNAAARYLKVYNTSAAPTVGTDVPVHTFIIPGNTAGAGTNIPIPATGINLATGISIALTTEATDAGTTGVAANEIVVNYAYI